MEHAAAGRFEAASSSNFLALRNRGRAAPCFSMTAKQNSSGDLVAAPRKKKPRQRLNAGALGAGSGRY
jgi:hypothetical protein